MGELLISTIWRGVDWCESGILWRTDGGGNLLEDPFYINKDQSIVRPEVENIGHRSARGLCYWGDTYWVAGYDFVANISLGPFMVNRVHKHPECLDIHNIYASTEGILVTSTYNNSVFMFDGVRFHKVLDLTKVFTNTNMLPDTLHLNSLFENYAVLCTYDHAHSAVVDLTKHKVVFANKDYVFGHDLHRINTGEYITNSSGKGKLLAFDEEGGCRILFDYKKYRTGDDSVLSKWGWIRGLFYDVNEDVLYLGAPPAKVLVFCDVSTKITLVKEIELYKHVDIGYNVDLSVFDIIHF